MAENKTKQAATEAKETAEPAKAKAPAKKAAKKSEPAPKKYSQDGRYRLYARYVEEIVPALMNERGYKNVMQVPKIDKIVVNMRLGDVKDNAKEHTDGDRRAGTDNRTEAGGMQGEEGPSLTSK